MLFDAIIFDCDGILVDSERLANEVLVEQAARFDVHLTVDEAVARFKGTKMADCVSHLEAIRGAALPASFVPDLRKSVAGALSSKLLPMEGALDLVRSLSVPFCVASSGPRDKIELSLAATGLLPFFRERIFSSYEIGSWKPHPGLFIHAAESLGANPQSCAVIEDSIPGIQAGIAARMTVFALVDGPSQSEIPRNVYQVSRLRELIGVLNR